MALRTCRSCSKKATTEEELSLFKKSSSHKSGRTTICKECHSIACRPSKEQTRNSNLKRHYGITLDDYDSLLEKQEYKCAICGTDTPNGMGRFHVDHNHATGEVRGLLCHGCNTALGGFKDSPDLLLKARDYLLTNTFYGEE